MRAPVQPHQRRVCLAIGFLVVSIAAGGMVGAASGGSSANLIQGISAADDPANTSVPYENETVTTAYIDNETGNVMAVTSGNHTIDLGVSGNVVGKGADIDDDWYTEIPYITGNNELYVIDRSGEAKQLASNAKSSATTLAATEFQDQQVVVYATSTSTNHIRSVFYNGTEEQLTNGGNAALGVGEATGDNTEDLLYLDSSNDIRYYNSSTGESGAPFSGASPGSNGGGIGAGAPRDFDNDSQVEVPIVGSGNNLYYIGENEDVEVETPHSGSIEKYPVGSRDLVGNTTPELLYVTDPSRKIRYVTSDSSQSGSITDASGNQLSTTQSAGVAYVNGSEEPLAVTNLTLVNDSGTLRGAFNASKSLSQINAEITGPDGQSLTRSNFTETKFGYDYRYTTNYTPDSDGNYTLTLDSVTADDGDTANPDRTANATVDTRFDIYALNATETQSKNLQINLSSDEELGSLNVTISGAESATLDLNNFTSNDSNPPYTYTTTYETDAYGTYNVTFNRGESHDGQLDDDTMEDSTTIKEPLEISNLTLANQSGTLTTSFNATKDLDSVDLEVTGPDSRSFSVSNLTETSGPDNYTYTGNYTPDSDGNYTADLSSATAADGETANPDLTANATVDVRFNITDLQANTTANRELGLAFNASEELSSVTVNITGAETATLGLGPANFTTNDSSAPYTYTDVYNRTAEGVYNVTVVRGESLDGQVDEPNLEASEEINESLSIWNLTLTDDNGTLITSFQTTEALQSVDASVDGPDSRTFSIGEFSETAANGNYTYTANYTPNSDGNYTAAVTYGKSTDGNIAEPDLTANATVEERFNVTNLTATGLQGGPLTINFTATDPVATATINVSGPENTTLDMDDFDTSDSNSPYRYNGSYNATTPGEYTVTFENAESTDGLTDDDPITTNATIDEQLSVWNFTLGNTSGTGNLTASFTANEPLSATSVTIDGTREYNLTRSNFTEAPVDDNYTYTTQFPTADGSYNGTLASAKGDDGEEVQPDLTDNTTINARFNVTNLTATGSQGGPLTINFTATDPVDTTTINVSGPENTTLGRGDFSAIDTASPYAYTGTYNASTPGNYTVTFQRAESESGLVDNETLTANATIDEQLSVWNFTLSNGTSKQNLSIAFHANEPLSGTDITITGPRDYTPTLSNFTEHASNGNYTYTTEFSTPDGTYNGTLASATGEDGELVEPDLTNNTTINARFNVTNLTAAGIQGGPLTINFTATDPVDTTTIDVSGPENTTLGKSTFTTHDSSAPYVYNGTYNASTPGEYTITFQRAESESNLVDDEPLNATATIDEQLRVWNFTLTEANGSLTTGFTASKQLTGIDATVDGPDSREYAHSDFNESGSNGNYTYITSYTPDTDGNYTATLASVTGVDGQSLNPDTTDNATVNERFNVTNLTAGALEGGPININFTASDPVDTTTVNISGPENTTLGIGDFTATDTNGPYVYTATYNTSTPGEYTVTFHEAESVDGLVDDEALNDTATIDELLSVWGFTLSNGTSRGNLSVAFQANEPLSGSEIEITGSTTYNLSRGNLSEQRSNGNYTYTTEFRTADGTYNGTLISATGDDGESVTPDLTDNTTINARFNVTNLTATGLQGGPLTINFTASDPVATTTIDVSGPENATLGMGNFSASDTASPYAYAGTYNVSTPGNYTVTLVESTSESGLRDAPNLTATGEIPVALNVTDLWMTAQAANVSVGFNATESLSRAPVTITGPTNQTLTIGAFSETVANGRHTYETTYQVSSDGDYAAELTTAEDTHGNEWSGRLTANTTVSTAIPRVNVTVLDWTDGNSIVNESDQVRIIANVSDAVDRVSLRQAAFTNGSATLNSVTDNRYATTTTVGNLTSGHHSVRVRAVDTADGDATSDTASIQVDTEPPVATIHVPETVTRGESVRLTPVNVTDEETRIVTAAWQINGQVVAGNDSILQTTQTTTRRFYAGTTASTTTTRTVNVENTTYTFSESGTQTVTFSVVDAAGNTNTESETVTVTEQSTGQPATGGSDTFPPTTQEPTATTTSPESSETETAQTTRSSSAANNTPTTEHTSSDSQSSQTTHIGVGPDASETQPQGEPARIVWVLLFLVSLLGVVGLGAYHTQESFPIPLLFGKRQGDENEDEQNAN